MAAMNQLLGGFGERARLLKETMRSGAFGYVLVTSPDATVVSEATELARAMNDRHLAFDALICNRVARGGAGLSDDAARAAIHALGAAHALADPALLDRVLVASRREDQRRARQIRMCEELVTRLTSAQSSKLTSFVPELLPQQAQRGVGAFAEALLEGTARTVATPGGLAAGARIS
jgi:hypothetical protein